jgi:hypothetical protein
MHLDINAFQKYLGLIIVMGVSRLNPNIMVIVHLRVLAILNPKYGLFDL